MLSVFDRYVLKIVLGAVFITALSLTLIILLTQSIRFLELVIGTDASIGYFGLMMGLAIPKFLEAILPIAFAIGVIYSIHRLLLDHEITIFQAAGSSVVQTGRPFMICAVLMMILQFIISGWISPLSVEKLQETRGDIKSHYATLMFREDVFNTISGNFTAFISDRVGLNELRNLMIHDKKGALDPGQSTTIIARRGIVNIDEDTQQLLVYDGTQYQKNLETGTISRLDFDQYILDIPTTEADQKERWQEPDERTLPELFINEATAPILDTLLKHEFMAEIHRRFSTPFLYVSYTALALGFLLMATWNRRQQNKPLILCGLSVLITHALYLVVFSETEDQLWMAIILYILAIGPGIIFAYRLSKDRL